MSTALNVAAYALVVIGAVSIAHTVYTLRRDWRADRAADQGVAEDQGVTE